MSASIADQVGNVNINIFFLQGSVFQNTLGPISDKGSRNRCCCVSVGMGLGDSAVRIDSLCV